MKRLLFILIFPIFVQAQVTNISINAGSGKKVRLNEPGRSGTVNIRIPEYYPYQSGDVNLEDRHFWFAHPGIALRGFVQRNTLSYIEFETEERQITLKIIGNWANKLTQSYINIQVDGVQNQFISLTTNYVEEQKTIVLPAGLKLVRIINGYNSGLSPFNSSVVYADAVVNVTGIITDSAFRIKVPTVPLNAKLWTGTSIATGASGTNPTVTGYPALFRSVDGWELGSLSWGGKIVQSTTEIFADSFAVIVDRMLNGRISNELFIDLGTNDYGIHNKTKAAFKTHYGLLLDAIIATRPDITIYCISPLYEQ